MSDEPRQSFRRADGAPVMGPVEAYRASLAAAKVLHDAWGDAVSFILYPSWRWVDWEVDIAAQDGTEVEMSEGSLGQLGSYGDAARLLAELSRLGYMTEDRTQPDG